MAGYRRGTPGYFAQQAKYHQTMVAKYGSEEEMKKHLREIAAIGGRNGHTGGFQDNRELAKRAGQKGGFISSRSEDKPSLEERRNKYKEAHGEGY